MSGGFTPGPWFVEVATDEDGAGTGTFYVCHEGTVSPDTAVCEVWHDAQANANLIAAAPDQHNALTAILAEEVLFAWANEKGIGRDEYSRRSAIIENAKAALARVTITSPIDARIEGEER